MVAGCFIIDPFLGLIKPTAQKDWLELPWTLHEMVYTVSGANIAFSANNFVAEKAKFVRDTVQSMSCISCSYNLLMQVCPCLLLYTPVSSNKQQRVSQHT